MGMNWTDILVAVIAAAGGCIGSIISNSKHLAVLETKLEGIKEEINRQGARIDAHNHLNERITKLEVIIEQQRGGTQT